MRDIPLPVVLSFGGGMGNVASSISIGVVVVVVAKRRMKDVLKELFEKMKIIS